MIYYFLIVNIFIVGSIIRDYKRNNWVKPDDQNYWFNVIVLALALNVPMAGACYIRMQNEIESRQTIINCMDEHRGWSENRCIDYLNGFEADYIEDGEVNHYR